MVYVVLSIILFLVILLYIPNRINLFINDKYVEIAIFKIRILRMNFSQTADYAIEQVKEYKPKLSDLEYLRFFRKIKFKLFEVNVGNIIEDYVQKNIVIGNLYALFGGLKAWMPYNSYRIYISQDNTNYFSFHSIFYFRLGKILVTFFSLRRKINARTSD